MWSGVVWEGGGGLIWTLSNEMKYEALFFDRGAEAMRRQRRRDGSRRKCEAEFFFLTLLQGFAKRSAACWPGIEGFETVCQIASCT
jgi:hypothetical protein